MVRLRLARQVSLKELMDEGEKDARGGSHQEVGQRPPRTS
jgi:hypothetical protein